MRLPQRRAFLGRPGDRSWLSRYRGQPRSLCKRQRRELPRFKQSAGRNIKMKRRRFIKTTLLAGGALAFAVPPGRAQTKPRKYHLRYAPHLTILSKELTIPQRLELIAEHGFDATEYNGLLNHPLNEVEEMRKKLDSLHIEMGIFVANPGGWKTAGLVDPKQRDAFLRSEE